MAQESKVKGLLSGIPGWAKGIILILIVLLIVWLVYKFYKQVGFKSADEKKEEKDIRKDLDMLGQQGQKPTFTRTQYKSFADKLYWAGSGKNITGTQEDQIYSVFDNMKNDMDIVLLTEAFGLRKWWAWQDSFNLGGYLTDELDESEIKIINNKLAAKGIKARF